MEGQLVRPGRQHRRSQPGDRAVDRDARLPAGHALGAAGLGFRRDVVAQRAGTERERLRADPPCLPRTHDTHRLDDSRCFFLFESRELASSRDFITDIVSESSKQSATGLVARDALDTRVVDVQLQDTEAVGKRPEGRRAGGRHRRGQAGTRISAPSGGSLSRSDCGRPCIGTGSVFTVRRVSKLLPPKRGSSLERHSTQRPGKGAPTR